MTKTTGCVLSLVTLAACGPAAAASIDGTAWIDNLHLRPGIPLVALPSWAGPVIGITETRKLASYTQAIILAGDGAIVGENSVVATVTRDGLAPRIDQNQILDEMQDSMPGIPMSVTSSIGQNALGIFGYALGSRGKVTCFYGWQAVNLADRWITGEDAGLIAEHHALSLRVRLCRAGMAPTELAGTMSALVSYASPNDGWRSRALMPPEGASYDALAAAQSIEPPALSGFAQKDRLGAPRQENRAARPRRARAGKVRTPPPADQPTTPLAGMPSVPMPQ